MKAIFAAIVLSSLAGPALAKPAKPKKPVEKAQRIDIRKLADGGLESLDTLGTIEPVLVDNIVEKPKAVADAPKLGLEYGLKQRHAALPSLHVEDFEAKPLTENQVGAIVRERAEDLEYCWLRLPQNKRVVSAAILHMSIEASGKVASVEVNGDLPAGVGKCITQMAGRWSFPAADAPSIVDHGIMLTTTSQKVR